MCSSDLVEGVEREDRTIPGPGGPLAIRIYRPVGGGVTPGIVFFHGGGWVIGSHVSDDPLCRDLCHRAGVLIVSVNYRHAPEFRFPAAVDDGYAATKWIAEHAAELGGIPGRVAVAGWSAGGNVAAVTTQMARDAGGPTICGQLLLTPVTDGTRSFIEWSAEFECDEGRENELTQLIGQGVFQTGFDALKRHFSRR